MFYCPTPSKKKKWDPINLSLMRDSASVAYNFLLIIINFHIQLELKIGQGFVSDNDPIQPSEATVTSHIHISGPQL